MTIILAAMLIYAAIGLSLVAMTGCRGMGADVLFAALWPVYIYLDWKNGLI